MQSHIEEILQAIQHIASGDFSYRAPLYNREEGLDAIALGINMLGEEIEAKINAHMQQNKTLKSLNSKVLIYHQSLHCSHYHDGC